MANTLWIVVTGTGLVWSVSVLVTAVLAIGAHRGDARVVVDDPWDTEQGRRDLARLREAAARARIEAAARDTDFSQWEHDFARPGPHVDRIAPRRPRPAA